MSRRGLPREFIENVVGVCGARGEQWLRDLPFLISRIEAEWKITVHDHFDDLSYNFVSPAVRADGSPAVLKLALPAEDLENYAETAYLRLLGGAGTVALLKEDLELRALLLERALPGHSLRKVFKADPSLAVIESIGLLRTLHRGVPVEITGFITLDSWTEKLNNARNYKFPLAAAERALSIFESAAQKECILLHGDFHHLNILSHLNNSFVAIDPKGLIGDPKYDIAVFLNNHRGWLRHSPDLAHMLDSAVNDFADAFGFSSTQIRQWAYAQKVLAAFWTVTEGGRGWKQQLASAEVWNV